MFIYTIYMESKSDLLFTLLLSLMSHLWVPLLASQTPVLITFYYKIICYWSININLLKKEPAKKENSYPNDSMRNHLLTIMLFNWEIVSIIKVNRNVEKPREICQFPKKHFILYLATTAQTKLINPLFCN